MFKSYRLTGFVGIFFLCLAQFIASGAAFAQSAEPTAVRDFYSTPGLNPFEERKNDSFNESISPFNGILQLSYNDVFLPGNGGLDIQVFRRYQSSVKDRNVKQVYGYGWDISFGELRFPTSAVMNDAACTTAVGIGDTRNNPVFITPAGGSEMMVVNDAGMAGASNALLVSKGRYMLACEPKEAPATGNNFVVYSPDGMRYELGFSSQVINVEELFRLYVTRISDPNGNEIRIDYEINPQFIVYISKVYDTGDGREVNFSYLDENTTDIRLQSIATSTQTWQYEYQGIVEYNDAVGALDPFLFYADFDNYHLLSVRRPDGREWRYEYYVETPVPNTIAIYENWHHLIKEVQYPFGSRIEYTYQDVLFGEQSVFYDRPNQVIKTKSLDVLSSDRISNQAVLSVGNTNLWTYSFFPGQGALEGQGQPIGDFTVVETPLTRETYLHYGYEHTAEEDIWRIGLLKAKSVYGSDPDSLTNEVNTWAPQTISTEQYWNGRGPNFVDMDTYAPLLVSNVVSQHGLLYTTDYSNHDAYGNPGRIERGGSSVSDTIDTTYDYFIQPDIWIVNRPQDETTVDVGTITRQYDTANGNLLEQNNYGVITKYSYTAEGDLATQTDANDKVTTYSDYYRGIPRRIEYPEAKIVLRTVNATGTVESETNGRGFTTRYDYDNMDRLTAIDYPQHADVTIEYSQSGQLERTLTRGSYRELTRFNTWMNPIDIEKTDLATGTTIYSANEYDILGRQTFVSKPSYTSFPSQIPAADRGPLGVIIVHDALGREIEVNNPDGSSRTTEYRNKGNDPGQPDPGSVRITDERGNVTVNRFYGYGSPDDNRLYRIEAPENMSTRADYDKLGNITEIWQGEEGGLGHERKYNFDSRYFLVSEDHPEIGHVVFGRDNVGNMTSRQVKNSDIAGSTLPDSEVTTYIYDGLNRLTTIDYPGSTPDVSYSYDGNDNVKTLDNANSTRSYDYDSNDNLISEAITIDAESYTLSYGYNNLDFLDTITYPSSRSVIYTNDSFGRPTRIINYVEQVNYFPGGQKESMTYANGVTTDFTLNEREWVSSIKASHPFEDEVIDLSYQYDGRGNVEQIIDGFDINTRVMTYDGLDRLITADGMWGSGSFSYDQEDNMKTRDIGGVSDVFIEENNKMLQLQRNGFPIITPAYDVYGNQLNTASRDLIFDHASNLRSAKQLIPSLATDIFFDYDGNNRRVAKRVGQPVPKVKHYVYSRGDVVFSEIDFDNNSTRENIFLGSQMIATVKFDSNDPVAQIAAPATALEKVLVTLDGTASFDPDGTIVSYEWEQQSGTPVAVIDLGNGTAEFESPIVAFDENLVFQLVVRDNDGNSASAVAGIEIQQTDSDGDTISDLWEEIYFPGNLTQMNGATDFDNDGISDVDEFRGGTEPINFDALDAPSGILVTTGVTSVDLAWPAVQRANRYAIYWSTTPQVPLTNSNRTYTSSSPLVQDDLVNGQFFYYVIVAERLDINGNFLGDSLPSDVVSVKVGWDIWPQRVLHTTQQAGDTSLEINDQGDVLASWEASPNEGQEGEGSMMYSSYTQQGGWTAATSTPPTKGLNEPDVRVVEQSDGIYAEYYVEGTGWTNAELLQAGANNEWYLYEADFNANGEGLTLIGHSSGTYSWLQYAPQAGWSPAQTLTLTPPAGGSISPDQLFLADNGVAQLLLLEVDGSNFSTGAITYDSANGWHAQVSLGMLRSMVSASNSGYVHLLGSNSGSPTLVSRHYTPGVGWSEILDVADQLVLVNSGLGGKQMDFEINNQGDGVIVTREAPGTGFTLREFSHASGWQAAVSRPDPTGCDYDDIPDLGEGFFSNGPPVRRDFGSSYFVSLDLEISDLGDWSVVTALSDTSPRSSAVFVARRDAQAGWLDTVILHCPYLHYGISLGTRDFSHAMNKSGTTFVIWPYGDDGEILSNTKVLSNKFEMLKGEPPVADAGADQSVTEGDEVFLDASLSSDPDDEIAAYAWTQLAGTPVNITDGDTKLASFIAPLVSADETLTFEVTVTDGTGNQASDTVDVIVGDFTSTQLGVVLSSSSASPLTVGDTLDLSAQAAGGSGGAFEYQFRFKSLNDSNANWSLLQDFGSVDSTSWDTVGLGGKYRLQVRAREVGNETVIVKDSISIWVNSILPLTGVTLASDAIGPQLEGFAAALTAVPASDTDPVEYRFELKNTAISPDWILLRDYAADPALSWDSSGYQGKNRLRVSARKVGTQDRAAKDTITLWINAPDAVTSVLLTPSLFSPQPSGTSVTLDATITGGNGGVEYRFSVKDTEGLDEWNTAQNWSTLASFAWDTTGIYGKQRIRVEARNVGSTDRVLTDKLSYWLNDANPLADVTLQADQPALIVVGPTITLTGVPSGTSNLYEYQFRVKGAAPGASWSVLRDYDADPSFQVASASFLGKNKFQVRARNQGTVDKHVKDGQTIWVNELNAITDVALSGSNTNAFWGEDVTFTMSFTGGDGSFYYRRELKRPGEGYVNQGLFRSETSNTFNFSVGGSQPGTYRMRVQAINAATDKPVKSNSVRFTVTEINDDPIWQIGGDRYEEVLSCTIYECPCLYFTCNDITDPGTVFGGGY